MVEEGDLAINMYKRAKMVRDNILFSTRFLFKVKIYGHNQNLGFCKQHDE